MASLVSALKRKLASILPFVNAVDEVNIKAASGVVVEEGDGRPSKRRRLICGDNDADSDDGAGADGTREQTFCHPCHPRQALSYTPLLVRESTTLADNKSTAEIIDAGEISDSDGGPDQSQNQPSALLRLLPHDVLSHCLSYINTPHDRFGLQVSCKAFCRLSNCDDMLAELDLGGDDAEVMNVYSPFGAQEETNAAAATGNADNINNMNNINAAIPGENIAAAAGGDDTNAFDNIRIGMALQSTPLPGIILDSDTSETACAKLIKYAAAGNMQAVYMIAMILCYCHENISEGLALLRLNASSSSPMGENNNNNNGKHHLPSIYALALILRDSRQIESDYYLNLAASLGYAPAWQEKLTAAEMRAQFGDLDATKLVQYLDPPCLNKLLGRHYLECQRVRKHQTSHCWNPLCGRWAYKALRVENFRQQQRRGRHHHLIARLRELGGGLGGVNDRNNDNDDDRDAGVAAGGVARHHVFEPVNAHDTAAGNHYNFETGCRGEMQPCQRPVFSIESLLPPPIAQKKPSDDSTEQPSPLEKLRVALQNRPRLSGHGLKVSRMKMCSSCRRAKYCSKLCQVYDWRSGRHKMECQFL